jgi:hypothetical protein
MKQSIQVNIYSPPVKRYLKFQLLLYTEHTWELGQHGPRVKYRALETLSRHAPFISNTPLSPVIYTCYQLPIITVYLSMDDVW